MRTLFTYTLLVSILISCQMKTKVKIDESPSADTTALNVQSGYSEVNGLKMYYEIYGEGKPLLLVHGGGSTIESTFGNIIPYLAKNHQVIAMEIQAHGHTADRDTALSFRQSADDIATLMDNLHVNKADFLGFSNGANVLIELALNHPDLINKLILASTIYTREGAPEQFWAGFNSATLDRMPQPLKDAYLKANNSPEGLENMFKRDVELMKGFTGWTDQQIQSIESPTLVINTTQDVASVEHATAMYRLIPHCELVILPGMHGAYLGTVETLNNGIWAQTYTVDILEEFLRKE